MQGKKPAVGDVINQRLTDDIIANIPAINGARYRWLQVVRCGNASQATGRGGERAEPRWAYGLVIGQSAATSNL